jgi:hypothetical protein
MKLIGEGIQSLVAEKWGSPAAETHIIIRSRTIILGQNSSDISQRIGEIWDSLIEMEVTLFTVTNHSIFPVFECLKISSWKVDYPPEIEIDLRSSHSDIHGLRRMQYKSAHTGKSIKSFSIHSILFFIYEFDTFITECGRFDCQCHRASHSSYSSITLQSLSQHKSRY